MEPESDADICCDWYAWYSHQRIENGTERHGNKRTRVDYPNYSIVEITQKTDKSPAD